MARKDSDQDLRESVRDHFENIAPEYDQYKHRAAYYHQQLFNLLNTLVPDASSRNILEIGCGTGTLLAALNPSRGLGIDISPRMIEIAQTKWKDHSHLQFQVGEAERLDAMDQWDTIILADVLEHLYDSGRAIQQLSRAMRPDSVLILTWANHLWSPILHVLELLKMKMPEGEHRWEPESEVLKKLEDNNFRVTDNGTRCLIPAALPLANTINDSFVKIPGIRRLGLIRFLKAIREPE